MQHQRQQVFAIHYLEIEFEVEFGSRNDALGKTGIVGNAGDAIDGVFRFGFGRQQVARIERVFFPVRVERTVPEGKAGGADGVNLVVIVLVGRATEQPEQIAFVGIQFVLLELFERKWFARAFRADQAQLPLQQAAYLALERRAGNVRQAGERVFDNLIVNPANTHFGIAATDVQAGFQYQGAGDLLDLGELHGALLIV